MVEDRSSATTTPPSGRRRTPEIPANKYGASPSCAPICNLGALLTDQVDADATSSEEEEQPKKNTAAMNGNHRALILESSGSYDPSKAISDNASAVSDVP
jgi:hypothetical protein